MATISGGQASVIAGGTASFGQFRLTTFVDSTPKASRNTLASQAPRTKSSEAVAEQSSRGGDNGTAMSSSHGIQAYSNALQSSSSQGFTPISPSSAAITAPSTESALNSHNGFGILDLAPPPAREGKLGPHRDGRVRNPVPLKLKGKTDDKNGNFAVMHMDMSGAGSLNTLPRSEAAQRTSENTANAAKSANKAGYTPVKRRRIEPPPDPQTAPDPPAAQTPAPFYASQQQIAHRARALTLDETKYEQARLLTLLRSINPLTVVDQICKALAFFGGIPGAPPPDDGAFPESADANGNGGLFVGWLSEIFPELDRKAWKSESPKSREESRGSRPRGRPKGSKASKVRKDKGIKKGPKNPHKGDSRSLTASTLSHIRPAPGSTIDADNPEEEWVDVIEVDLQLDKDGSQQQRLPDLAERSRSRNPSDVGQQSLLASQISSVSLEMLDVSHNDQDEHHAFGALSQEYSPKSTGSSKRRPGRPKGSRNRPKNSELDEDQSFDFLTSDQQILTQIGTASTIPESLRHPGRPLVLANLKLAESSHTADQVMSFSPNQKSVSGNTQQSLSLSTKRRQGQANKEAAPIALASSAHVHTPGLSPEEQAVLEAFRNARAAQAANKMTTTIERGKRPRPKSAVGAATDAPVTSSTILANTTANLSSAGSALFSSQTTPTPQSAQKGSTPAPTLPPLKRQRKPKESNSMPPKKAPQVLETPNASTSGTGLKLTTGSTDSVAPAMVSSIRPPAQGLEAHYERFASLQHQGDQQQNQQQQQSRHDLTSVTRSSPMQSTAAYYQQPRHMSTSYDQQYPSHQTSNPYQPALISQADSFRSSNQNPAFSSRQQQSAHHFSHFTDSSFIDVPALESVANGTGNVGTYGQNISRSASNGGFNSGAQMANGFGSMSDNDIRDRLLRGIGR